MNRRRNRQRAARGGKTARLCACLPDCLRCVLTRGAVWAQRERTDQEGIETDCSERIRRSTYPPTPLHPPPHSLPS